MLARLWGRTIVNGNCVYHQASSCSILRIRRVDPSWGSFRGMQNTLTQSARDGLDSLWGRLPPVSHSKLGRSPGARSTVFTATWGGKHEKEVFDLRITDLRVSVRKVAWRMSSSQFAFVACWACSLHGKIRHFLFVWRKHYRKPKALSLLQLLGWLGESPRALPWTKGLH